MAGANVTNVAVACVTDNFTVVGTLTGLADGASVTLQNNGGDDLSLTADGSFSFAAALTSYCQIWCMPRKSSGDLVGLFDLFSVNKCHAFNDLCQVFEAA